MRNDGMRLLRRRGRQDTIGPVPKLPDRVLPDAPAHRPIERFWPYAELSEQPGDEELARLHPELRAVLFGEPPRPFSISIAFPAFEGEACGRAVELARRSDEYDEYDAEGVRWHRARFFPGDRPVRLRDLYELVGSIDATEVLIDDRPLPYARELWLPLVWFLIR
jgi:hypothetical protein